MKMNWSHGIIIVLLAVIFTIGLTFASIELPAQLDTFLQKNIDAPDVATGLNELSDFKTDLYLNFFHLRLIGYVCLALIIIMIVVGFVTEKAGWTYAGALVLFLPVFGHFAATMFFLGGLGFLRLVWLPIMDPSFMVLRLGDIILLPYRILEHFWSWTGLNHRLNLSYVITGLGLLVFFLGTLTWFYAKMQKKSMANFWMYRFSRHPQYLGWIIWSYGVMFLPRSNIKLCYELSNSLPWLFSTMVIFGVAMLEELKMKKIHGEEYESYRKHTPFLFPLPRFVSQFLSLPLRVMFKKKQPERKREIVAVLAFYTLLCLGVSAFYGGVVSLPWKKRSDLYSSGQVDKWIRVLEEADSHGEKRRAAAILEGMGEAAEEPLLALLEDKDSSVRGYSAGALGTMKSERVVSSLIALLHDEDSYVRRTAASSLGRIGSVEGIKPLIEAMQDPVRNMANAAVNALGQIRHPDVIIPLIQALRTPAWKAAGAAAQALGALEAREAVAPLIQCFEEMPDCPYDAVGAALWKLGSDRAADAWIAGLKKGSWWYSRTVCAAELGRKRIEEGLIPLQEALGDSIVEVRRAAVLALMEFQSEKTTDALKNAMKDEDFEVRIYAEEALKKIAMKIGGNRVGPEKSHK